MSYIVLARKYRPLSFDDLVGQRPVSQTLRNALESGRIAHAYIFSGPRGVGKTTTARILAKCLNCQKGSAVQPCHKCESCVSIGQGTSMDDVLEIDGASNRGIEQIRELRENAKYSPSKSRYRIYIIDEAHQITKDAFGALLKTLEEPPAHVIFMMATTEVHKIPAPILSRCQRFSLRPIAPDLVFQHLKSICKKEKIKVEDDALKNIVRFVEGSLRDALSLLDQALVFSPDGITTETLRELLGLLPTEIIYQFADAIKEGDPSQILKSVTQAVHNGIDLTQLGKDLQNHYHTILLSKAGVNDPLLTGDDAIKKQVGHYDFPVLERNIRLLSKALEEMRRSDTPRTIFEIHALKLGQKILDTRSLLARLDQLQAGPPPAAIYRSPQTSTSPTQGTPSIEKKNPQPSVGFKPPSSQPRESKQFVPTPVVPTTVVPTTVVPTTVASASVSPTPVMANYRLEPQLKETILMGWGQLVEEISKDKHVLAAALEEATLSMTDTSIQLLFNKSFSQQLVSRSMDLIKPYFLRQFNVLFPIESKMASPQSKSTSSTPPLPSEAHSRSPYHKIEPPKEQETHFEEVSSDQMGPDVQKALKHFPGVLKRERTSE